jgi:hypothetical protein
VSYYAIGGLVYDELEGWPLLDTAYFLTVTITTVGYGDICPESDEGKLFTVLYALVGIVFVFAALSPLVDLLMWVKDTLLKPITPYEPTDPRSPCMEDGQLDIDDLRRRGNWSFKYGAALAGPGIIFVIGLVIGFSALDLNLVDGVYWSMITMSTIGYGDIAATTPFQQAPPHMRKLPDSGVLLSAPPHMAGAADRVPAHRRRRARRRARRGRADRHRQEARLHRLRRAGTIWGGNVRL